MSKPKRTQAPRVPVHTLPVEERDGNFNEVHFGYITLDEVVQEANRCIMCKKPRCQIGCPAHCRIPDMLYNIREGDEQEAVRLAYEWYAFPRSLHRICPALCVQNCILGKKGDPVNIFDVVRWIVDKIGRPAEWYETAPETGKKVAIIGSGPAGLTAAYYLRKKGHAVTIYEKLSIPGGMLAVGIPEYRLKNEVLFEEIEEIKKTGVELVLNKAYGKDFNYKHLFEMGYNAVIIAHGAHKPKWMNIPGQELKGNMHAINFLRDVALGKETEVGKKVAVIGGGDVAIDAVRVSRRLGSDSFIVYRRSIEEMPATDSEIRETQEENIPIHFLTNPVKIIGDENGHVKAIELIKMELGEPDESGRRRPVPIEGSEYTMEVDTVIQAISQQPDDDELGGDYDLTKWATFKVNEETNMTNVEGVFAAGDDVTGPYLAITAIADAHKTVRAVHEFLSGEKTEAPPEFMIPNIPKYNK